MIRSEVVMLRAAQSKHAPLPSVGRAGVCHGAASGVRRKRALATFFALVRESNVRSVRSVSYNSSCGVQSSFLYSCSSARPAFVSLAPERTSEYISSSTRVHGAVGRRESRHCSPISRSEILTVHNPAAVRSSANGGKARTRRPISTVSDALCAASVRLVSGVWRPGWRVSTVPSASCSLEHFGMMSCARVPRWRLEWAGVGRVRLCTRGAYAARTAHAMHRQPRESHLQRTCQLSQSPSSWLHSQLLHALSHSPLPSSTVAQKGRPASPSFQERSWHAAEQRTSTAGSHTLRGPQSAQSVPKGQLAVPSVSSHIPL